MQTTPYAAGKFSKKLLGPFLTMCGRKSVIGRHRALWCYAIWKPLGAQAAGVKVTTPPKAPFPSMLCGDSNYAIKRLIRSDTSIKQNGSEALIVLSSLTTLWNYGGGRNGVDRHDPPRCDQINPLCKLFPLFP